MTDSSSDQKTNKRIDGESDAAPMARRLLDRFELIEEIGHGGMGIVYSARDWGYKGGPRVAIKLLGQQFKDDEAAITGLQIECRRTREFAHDAIVRVFEFFRTKEDAFIVMELLEGETLESTIRRNPTGMPFERAWPIIREAGSALAYAHKQKPPYVHYDFKPTNVFLTIGGHVKVLDFGVARAIRSKTTTDGKSLLHQTVMPGFLTPNYASCEMLAGIEPDPRDDIYALGCVAYELLSGEHPFASPENARGMSADAARTLDLRARRIKRLSTSRNDAISRALAFKRADRTASVDEFLAALEPPSDEEVSRRRRYGAAAVVAVLILAGIGFAFWKSPLLTRPTAASTMAGPRVAALYRSLGITTVTVEMNRSYARSVVLDSVKRAPRHVSLGSTPAQIEAAYDLCRHFSRDCTREMYADETSREVVLQPFLLDSTAVSLDAFSRFAEASGYRTDAEKTGIAFTLEGDALHVASGGYWKNAVRARAAAPDNAVVGVSLRDAREYCKWRDARLPTEDEWEYTARGPAGRMFAWGDDIAPALVSASAQPSVNDGPREGIAGIYRGLSGHVWEWVDTEVAGMALLKGGSWMETNPANKRAAVRRIQAAVVETDDGRRVAFADSVSGFRCAKSVAAWTDSAFWIDSL
jgi:formylglycine-generating enzyme required for sulfatase activity